MRGIFTHIINRFNREHVNVIATDQPDPSQPNYNYAVSTEIRPQTSEGSLQTIESCVINFQKGKGQPNGITDEALLAVVLDRLQGFQRGPRSCRENAVVITKIEECLMWLEKRSRTIEEREEHAVRASSA